MQHIRHDQCCKEAQQQPGAILIAGGQCHIELLAGELDQSCREVLIIRVQETWNPDKQMKQQYIAQLEASLRL